MDRVKQHWVPAKPKCEGGQGFATVGLTEVGPAIWLLVIAMGVSLAIWIIEFLTHYLLKVQWINVFQAAHSSMKVRP